KGFGKQLLLQAPGLAMMVVSRAIFLCYIAAGSLLMMGLLAGPSVKGLWRWMLLLVPALAMMAYIQAYGSRPADALTTQVWPNLMGFAFGIGLMISAHRQRQPIIQKPESE